jgi:hypothetical protein
MNPTMQNPIRLREQIFDLETPFATSSRVLTPMESKMLPPRENHARYAFSFENAMPIVEAPDIESAIDYAMRMQLIVANRAVLEIGVHSGRRLLFDCQRRKWAIETFVALMALYSTEDFPKFYLTLAQLPGQFFVGLHDPKCTNIWKIHSDKEPIDTQASPTVDIASHLFEGAMTLSARLLVIKTPSHHAKSHA